MRVLVGWKLERIKPSYGECSPTACRPLVHEQDFVSSESVDSPRATSQAREHVEIGIRAFDRS